VLDSDKKRYEVVGLALSNNKRGTPSYVKAQITEKGLLFKIESVSGDK
jgi:hypothetical protein